MLRPVERIQLAAARERDFTASIMASISSLTELLIKNPSSVSAETVSKHIDRLGERNTWEHHLSEIDKLCDAALKRYKEKEKDGDA